MELEMKIKRELNEPTHLHLNIELLYIMEGFADVEVLNNQYHLKVDDILLVNSNSMHSIRLSPESLVCQITLNYIELTKIFKQMTLLFWCNSAIDDSSAYKKLRVIIEELIKAQMLEGSSELTFKSLYFKLLDCLNDSFQLQKKQLATTDTKDHLIRYINMNYWRPLTLQEVSEQVHMSYAAFSKYFKKTVGMNFLEYLSNVRMHFAMEDLLYSDKRITNIALDHGFSNSSQFNKMFKNSYDMTPTDYRRKMQKTVEDTNVAIDDDAQIILEKYFAQRHSTVEQINTLAIQADVASFHSYQKVWNKVVNIGQASALLAASMQEHMCIAREDLGISHVRIVNIFSWDMQMRKDHDYSELNFEKIDHVLDCIVDAGLHPFIEFGDKPASLFKSNQELYEEHSRYLFRSHEEWEGVVRKFTEHIVARYGVREVQNWIFELWFDASHDRKGRVYDKLDYDYLYVFEKAAGIIKAASPESKIGGPGLAPLILHKQFNDILPVWKAQKYPPDFISLYSYPYYREDMHELITKKPNPHLDFIQEDIDRYTTYAERWDLSNIPLYITEWNSSISQRNYHNDSCGKAAILLKNMIDNCDRVELASYNALSDLVGSYFDSIHLINGVSGLMSKEGIAKPAYYVFKFFNQLGAYRIQYGDGYIITTDGNGNYQILCCNYKNLNSSYYLKSEDEIRIDDLDGIFSDMDVKNLQFDLSNMPKPEYTIKTHTVNERYGNLIRGWKELGRQACTREEVKYLRRSCMPRIQKHKAYTKNGRLFLDETLEAHEIKLIFIESP